MLFLNPFFIFLFRMSAMHMPETKLKKIVALQKGEITERTIFDTEPYQTLMKSPIILLQQIGF